MSPVNEAIAYFDPGDDLTCQAAAAITGRRFVVPTLPKQVASQALASDGAGGNPIVAMAGAGVKPLGVSTYDQPTIGGKIPIMRGHKVVPVEMGAAGTVGAEVQSDATGRAIPLAAGRPAGMLLNTPTAAGQIGIVALDL